MKPPNLRGIIRRRLLVNFRVDPDVIQRLLPGPFRPALAGGFAMAGICLIRLEQVRPVGLPAGMGIASENAAHRIAVRWADGSGQPREGVYIVRRDSDSLVNRLAGGSLFPGEHHRAAFRVREEGEGIDLSMRSADGDVRVEVRVRRAPALPAGSVFASVAEASAFFERGACGYSATRRGDRLDGLELHTDVWQVLPLETEHVYSSDFADTSLFPGGSVAFDSALLMENVAHEWRPLPPLACGPVTAPRR